MHVLYMYFKQLGVYIHFVAPSPHFTYSTACCRDNCGHGDLWKLSTGDRKDEEKRGRLRGERKEQEIEKQEQRVQERAEC